MAPNAELILHFGSRSGSWFALGLFCAMFLLLGLVASREIRRRSPASSPWLARALGFVLLVGPVSLIYVTSIGGFYEASLRDDRLRLHYLFGTTAEIPAGAILDVKATPWYRGRWRLQVSEVSGRTYESATWDRQAVTDAMMRLKQALAR